MILSEGKRWGKIGRETKALLKENPVEGGPEGKVYTRGVLKGILAKDSGELSEVMRKACYELGLEIVTWINAVVLSRLYASEHHLLAWQLEPLFDWGKERGRTSVPYVRFCDSINALLRANVLLDSETAHLLGKLQSLGDLMATVALPGSFSHTVMLYQTCGVSPGYVKNRIHRAIINTPSLSEIDYRAIVANLNPQDKFIATATEKFLATRNAADIYNNDIVECIPNLKERIARLELELKVYCQQRKVPYNLREIRSLPSLITMALEIITAKRYDLAVGVIRSGSPLAVLLELLGLPAAYIDPYRNDIDKSAQWVGKEPDIGKGTRVLVCEDDTVSLGTLLKVAPVIVKSSENVDIGFYGFKNLEGVTDEQRLKLIAAGYSFIRSPQDVQAKNFFEHLAIIEEKLAQMNQVDK